jgi:mono/diheme cytochrome c family protein
MGIYRGGDRPEDIYRRIVQGIEGTPMPAVALKPDNPQGLTEDEVWQLVAYVMNMKQETQRMSSSAIGFALQKPNRESQP